MNPVYAVYVQIPKITIFDTPFSDPSSYFSTKENLAHLNISDLIRLAWNSPLSHTSPWINSEIFSIHLTKERTGLTLCILVALRRQIFHRPMVSL